MTSISILNADKTNDEQDTQLPLIIIGTGPVGIRALQSYVKENPDCPIVIFGKEPWEPYNRVQLSSFLSGEVNWDVLTKEQSIPDSSKVYTNYHNEIISISPSNHYVTDKFRINHKYSKLIIATGSYPYIPDIRGVGLDGVYFFRDLDDAQKLFARRTRTRRTVIIGGGLLGLETARAMSRLNTEVVVVDHSPYLMNRQLDRHASDLLREKLMRFGIKIYLGLAVRSIIGEKKVECVELTNGLTIECDTIIVSAGIRPSIELARDAGLRIRRGIKVNNQMQTSHPDIYAIGECAEHNDQLYGLVAPGFEQAEVAVASLINKTANYSGSISATQLKVMGVNVLSIGDLELDSDILRYTHVVYDAPDKGIYRKLVFKRGRLIGVIATGDWEATGRIRDAVMRHARIWPWQVMHFRKNGDLWTSKTATDIASWPAITTICNCRSVSRGECSKSIKNGCISVACLTKNTGAGSVCGSCKPLLNMFFASSAPVEAIKNIKTLVALSIVSVLMLLAYTLIPSVPYSASVESSLSYDIIWRSSLIKQISGYSILVLVFIGLLLSLRKRIRKLEFLSFSFWRIFHISSALLALLVLFVHTGFRFGNNLNFYLMTTFTTVILAGIATSIILSMQHRVSARAGKTIKQNLTLLHIILSWPIPVLVSFHIMKTYYF